MEISIVGGSSTDCLTDAISQEVENRLAKILPKDNLSLALEDCRMPDKVVYELAMSSSEKYNDDARFFLSIVHEEGVFSTSGALPEGIAVRGYGGLCVPYRLKESQAEGKVFIGLQCGHDILNMIGVLSVLRIYMKSTSDYQYDLEPIKEDPAIAAIAILLGPPLL